METHRIGLILGTKDTDYPHQIRMGVQNTLEAAGHTLINIADLIPYHTHVRPDVYMRVTFEIVRRIDLDAVIVPMGTLFGYLDNDLELTVALVRSLDPAKTVIVEREVEGYRSITKDGTPGMRACIRHLIEDCGLTKIAFVSGPANSVGARQREQAYFEEMAAHGLTLDETWFTRGEFSGKCAEAVKRLLDDHPDVEALACAADLIAFTCYNVLRERGYAVGEDVAVTGFDDHPSAAHIDPPLSTVRLTGYDLGCVGAREAIRLVEGVEQKERILGSTFVARGSCGEDRLDDVTRCANLLQERPFPYRKVAELLAEDTLDMAGPDFSARYADTLERVVRRVVDAYRRHLADPGSQEHIFSTRDFYELFPTRDMSHLSMEGFHGRVVTLLKGRSRMVDRDEAFWLGGEVSDLHLHVMRMQFSLIEELNLSRDKREYFSFRVAEDALLEDHDRQGARRQIMEELFDLGIDEADLFLLDEPLPISAKNTIGLADTVTHIASLHAGVVTTPDESVSLLGICSGFIDRFADTTMLTLVPLMAGLELVGLMLVSAPKMSDNGQLMASLDVAVALKLLQMLSLEREMNEILSRNNLLLERESTHDEMTGVLNRRGLMDAMFQALDSAPQAQAAVYYFDLDGLKYINDHLGHDVGDDAIKTSARLIVESLPEGCLVGRMGGDEFVALSLVEDEREARALVSCVMDAFKGANAGERPCDLSISAGMQMVDGTGDVRDRIDRALSAADTSMYAMKERHHGARRFVGATGAPVSQ